MTDYYNCNDFEITMILCIIALKTIDLTQSKSKAGISDHGVTSDVDRRYFIDADQRK